MLAPNESYRRMARPVKVIQPPGSPVPSKMPEHRMTECFPYEVDVRAISVAQLRTLIRQLDRICQTVHPDKSTLEAAFGHDIRNLLIIACTQVESHWRGVVVANGVPARRFTTEDYVVLQEAMRLGEYKVSFPAYPWLDPIRPFAKWTPREASRSLPWYHVYNDVKHNREGHFKKANLERAFEAVTACVIMAAAQFGISQMVLCQPEVTAFFHFVEVPAWREEDCYIWDSTRAPADMPLSVVPGRPRTLPHGNWLAVAFPAIKKSIDQRCAATVPRTRPGRE
jgi:hypothetical protein